jgi:hypothetical protein
MHVLRAAACREIDVLERGVANIVEAGLNTVVVDDLPLEVAFTVAAMIAAPQEEIGETFDISVELYRPGNPPLIQTLELPVEVEEPDADHHPTHRVTDFCSVDVVFQAEAEGIYEVNLRDPDWHEGASAELVRGCPVFLFVRLSDEAHRRITESAGDR